VPAEWTLLVAVAMLWFAAWSLRPVAWRAILGFLLLAAIGLMVPGFRAQTLAWRWAPHRLVASHDGPFGNTSVLETGGERAFFVNGVHAFETGAALAGEQWVDLPLLAHPSPRRVLLVGGGPRTVREVLGHHPESVIYVELDPVLIDAGRRYAPPELVRVLDDRRVRIVLGDARLHASRLAREHGPFDAILVALGDPTTAQLNRYYTLEWFRQAAGLLADGGLLGFHLMSSGDYLSDDLRSYNACVFHTARAAGLHLDVFPGLQAVFVASRTPGATVGLSDPPGALAARLRSRGLPPDLLLAAFYDALDPSRRSDRRRELEAQRDVRRNRDLTPTCYYYAQVLWASWWRDSTRGLLRSAQRLTLGHVLGLIALTAVAVGLACRLSRSPGRVAAPYALLVTGAGGMTLEVALLLGLQSLYGYVYGIVGYAVGVLMAGLAVGAWWAQRLDRVRPDAALVLTQVGLILAAAATPLGLLGLQRLAPLWASTSWLPVAAISLLMGLTGLVVGATFPCALRLAKGVAVHGATALYAIDLLGACGGALLAGLALIPLLGVAATCSAVGLAAATSALIGGVAPRKGECT
jgi:spermidine synthase